MYYLTLVSSETDKPLTAGHLAEAENRLDIDKVAIIKQPEWLSKHKAADIALSSYLTEEQLASMKNIFAADKIDVFCTDAENRKKKLLLADMDSTIVTSETLDEIASYAGIKHQIAAITERAMNGELDFEEALKERVALLKDLPAEKLQETLNDTVMTKGAEIFVRTMRKHGAICVLVSGGFTFFTGAIAQQAHFHYHHGNVLEVKDGKLTGTVEEPILDKNAKLRALKEYLDEMGLDVSQALTIGDGANDLPMLKAAGLGIGFHPKPVVKEELSNIIEFGDLTAALYMQGYKDEDFIQIT